jgi:hypothetical protein
MNFRLGNKEGGGSSEFVRCWRRLRDRFNQGLGTEWLGGCGRRGLVDDFWLRLSASEKVEAAEATFGCGSIFCRSKRIKRLAAESEASRSRWLSGGYRRSGGFQLDCLGRGRRC